MAENELQELIKSIFNRIKEKYGYTDEQALIYLQGCQDCAEENQKSLEKRDKMLRDTVAELVEAKRLLKVAVEDLYCTNDCVVCMYVKNNNCPDDRENCGFKWRYADEAVKLLGDTENDTIGKLKECLTRNDSNTMAKWIYDGDCWITSCCNMAFDVDKFIYKGSFVYLPCKCPNCGCELKPPQD